MRRNEERPEVLREPRGAKADASCPFFLAKFRRQVNLSGFYFRTRSLSGLLTGGVWCERLTLWCPLLDMTAKVLREVVEGRV